MLLTVAGKPGPLSASIRSSASPPCLGLAQSRAKLARGLHREARDDYVRLVVDDVWVEVLHGRSASLPPSKRGRSRRVVDVASSAAPWSSSGRLSAVPVLAVQGIGGALEGQRMLIQVSVLPPRVAAVQGGRPSVLTTRPDVAWIEPSACVAKDGSAWSPDLVSFRSY